MKVTAVTLTYNEEESIGNCIDSVVWCDEHIVVDEYSSDNTVEVAKEYGAKVFQKETPKNANSYEILRKFAVEQASNNWILRIDADEQSHPRLNTRLKELVAKQASDVIMVPRMTFLGDEWVNYGRQWWPDRSPILFTKDAVTITDTIHRSLNINQGANVIQLPADPELALHHYSYDSFLDFLQKRWRWSKIDGDAVDYPLSHVYDAISVFLESYIVDGGFRNGMVGLSIACIDTLYHLMVVYYSIRRSKA